MTSDLFDPTLWQNWALLLAVLIGLGWGYSVASLEDQRRRQQKRKGQRARSGRSQAPVVRPRQAEMAVQRPRRRRAKVLR